MKIKKKYSDIYIYIYQKGVKYQTLGELCEIKKGQQLNKNLLLKDGQYPVMNGGVCASGYWNEYNTKSQKIIISQGGASAGYVNFMTTPFWAGAHCFVIESCKDILLYRFLYFVLKNNESFLIKSQFGAGIPALNKADLQSLKIPLPPLEIQNEIVRILDKFNELDSNLKQELALRKKQYNYYRDLLLDFKDIEKKDHYSNSFYSKHNKESHKQIIDPHSKALAKESHIFKIDSQNKNPKKESEITESKEDSKISNIFKDSQNNKSNNTESKHTIKAILERKSYPKKLKDLLLRLCSYGVEYKSIQEVFTLKNGYTPSKANPLFWENGVIPWFRMEDIRINGRILYDSIQHITPQAVKGNKLFPKDSIIIATTATIGEHALLKVNALTNQQFTCLSKKADYEQKLDMKYFYYYCFLLGEWCKNNVNTASFASVDMEAFKLHKIPLPPLEIQNEIVRILDTFETLTNDLTTGIPAEIALRKKQYEYYRNKLLSFRELEQ